MLYPAQVTLEEALAVLEITAESSPDETKRAYLRQVKRHGPERDPQGFQRVREAYERVCHRLQPPGGTGETTEQAPVSPSGAPGPQPAGEPVPSWRALWARASQARTADDWEVVAQAFAQAAHDPDLPSPPVSPAVDVLLRLLIARRHEEAEQLEKSVSHSLAQVSGEAGRARRFSASWVLFQELWAVRSELPAGMTAAVAEGILAEDVGQAHPYVKAEYRRAPQATLEAIELLAHRAPVLGPLVDPFRGELPGTLSMQARARAAHEERMWRWDHRLWDRRALGLGALLVLLVLLVLHFHYGLG